MGTMTENEDIPPRPEVVAFAEAKKAAGGAKALAIGLGIIPSSVGGWKRVPAERVLQVEKLTKVPRWRLRPDIYPAPKSKKTAAARG